MSKFVHDSHRDFDIVTLTIVDFAGFPYASVVFDTRNGLDDLGGFPP